MLFLNPAHLTAFLFGLRSSVLFNGLWISVPFFIQSQIFSDPFDVGHNQLNINNKKDNQKLKHGSK